MLGLDRLDSLGRRHQADELDLPGARLLELLQRVHRAAACREHRVEHVHAGVGQPGWQPLVVVDRDVLLLVAVDPDVADAGIGQQPQEALDHPQPGAQDGYDRDLVAQAMAAGDLERRLDLDLLDRQLPRDLDGHDRRGLEQRLAEVAVRVSRSRITVSRSARTGCSTTLSISGTAAMLSGGRLARYGGMNVELKARDPDPEETAAAASPSARLYRRHAAPARHVLCGPRGRLKLRERERSVAS